VRTWVHDPVRLLLAFLAILLTAGCGSDSTPSVPDPIEPAQDRVLEERQAVIGSGGGSLALSDGARLVVPAGALSAEAEVGMTKLGHPQDFGEGAVAYELSGLQDLAAAATLVLPTPGLEQAEDGIGICRYDTETGLFEDTEAIIDFAARTATITLDPTAGKARGFLDRLRYLVQIEGFYGTEHSELLLRLPFYEQISTGCWAASCLMVLRAHRDPTESNLHLGDALHFVGASESDYGLNIRQFTETMLLFLHQHTGAPVSWRGYMNHANLRYRILRLLDAGYPVLVNIPIPGQGRHVVVVIGYRLGGQEFIIHDPQAITEVTPTLGTMQTVRPADWFADMQAHAMVAIQAVWVERALPATRPLQTIGCPGEGHEGPPTGFVTFDILNPADGSGHDFVKLRFKPSATTVYGKGYVWQSQRDDAAVPLLPATTANLRVRTPLWNAHPGAADVAVRVQVNAGADRLVWQDSELVSLPPAADNTLSVQEVSLELPLGGTRHHARADANGVLPLAIWGEVNTLSGAFLDGFGLYLNISVVPVLGRLEPTSANPGDVVTIHGMGFGDSRSTKSQVLIGTTPAVINSWADATITVEVPPEAMTGPLVVETGEQHRYASNALTLTIGNAPRILGFDPPHCDGSNVMTLTILGENFGDAQGASQLYSYSYDYFLIYGDPPSITICPRGYKWWDGSPHEIDFGYYGVRTYTFAIESWSDTAISVRALEDGVVMPVRYLFHPWWHLAIKRADGIWSTGSNFWT